MNKTTLSYVITTYNKLPYLKEAMKRLLENVQEDEEIIVTDGASTDGTVEYLTELYQQGKIHQFISEPDKGEAHGYNKGMLMAKGELIKLITDDDVFYYPAIQECKKFMIEHPEMDVMSGNVAGVFLENLSKIEMFKDCENNYHNWMNNCESVWFSGLPLMLRKKSLSVTGLFFSGMKWVDTEFSLRITHLNINIAWNTGLIAIRIDNPQSNFRNFGNSEQYQQDYERMYFFYNFRYREQYRKNILQLNNIKTRVMIVEIFKRPLRLIKTMLLNIKDFHWKSNKVSPNELINSQENIMEINVNQNFNIENAFSACENILKEYNFQHEAKVLSK
jgi:glycosyltransferase involved in cell wall biosynthesis